MIHQSRPCFVLLVALLTASPGAAADEDPGLTRPLVDTVGGTGFAPFLTPEEAVASFQIEPGFRVEIAAAEPLVHHPVALDFDTKGRMWVVEMPGYMQDLAGTGAGEPSGTVIVLEDLDGDGRADRRTCFLDGLVLPRAVRVLEGGALVGEPPNLWFCPDENGDLVADRKILLRTDFSVQGGHPAYQANGLEWNLDNWIYSAAYSVRLRRRGDVWEFGSDLMRGQWGLSHDDRGRLFFNLNEQPLQVDLIPSHDFVRNPNSAARSAASLSLASKAREVWPMHPTPGVTSGYREGILRDDGTLREVTAACGPEIYRGDGFPDSYQGNAFVCESAVNLVKRYRVDSPDFAVAATDARPGEEFLRSPDERFRPVTLQDGPDGCLYLLDMSKGIIEYRLQISAALEAHIQKRGLDKPSAAPGRIYRIVHESGGRKSIPAFDVSDPEMLVGLLDHPRGWVRDTAQRLLVERGGAFNRDLLAASIRRISGARDSSGSGKRHARTRLHALWTLQGLDLLTPDDLLAGLSDKDPILLAMAVRLSRGFFSTPGDALLLERIRDLQAAYLAPVGSPSRIRRPSMAVQVDLVLAMGDLPDPARRDQLTMVLQNHATRNHLVDAALSGLRGDELECIEILLISESWKTEAPGRGRVFRELASCVARERDPDRVSRFLDVTCGVSPAVDWRMNELLVGFSRTIWWARRRPLMLREEPLSWRGVAPSADSSKRSAVEKIRDAVTWPGREEGVLVPDVLVRNPDQELSFGRGRELFAAACAGCHQLDGMGQKLLAPPILGSPWLLGSPQRLVRIVLNGLTGPVVVQDESWDASMPSFGVLSDGQIADILTFLRGAWDHRAHPVPLETVSSIREQVADREDPWTVKLLEAFPR